MERTTPHHPIQQHLGLTPSNTICPITLKVLREDLEALAVPVGIDPVERHVKALVDAAPRLSDEQIARLRFALGGAA